MGGSRVTGVVGLVVALHVAVLSTVFGPRHVGYMLSATLSGTLIWGGVFQLDDRRLKAGSVVGAVLALAVQQVAFQVCKGQLAGFWWPLAQFGALQFLCAYGLRRCRGERKD